MFYEKNGIFISLGKPNGNKRHIAVALLLCLCLSLFPGCGKDASVIDPGKPADVREETLKETKLVYSREGLPWRDENTMDPLGSFVEMNGFLYAVGSITTDDSVLPPVSDKALFRMSRDGSNQEIIARQSGDGAYCDSWECLTTVGGKLYAYNYRDANQTEKNKLIEFDGNGTILRELPLDLDGELVISMTSSDKYIYCEGISSFFVLSVEDSVKVVAKAAKGSDGMVRLRDGRAVKGYKDSDGNFCIGVLNDDDPGQFSQTVCLSNRMNIYCAGDEYDLYLELNGDLYGLSLDTGIPEKLLSLAKLGFSTRCLLYEQGGGSFLCYGNLGMTNEDSLFCLRQMEVDENAPELTIATLGGNMWLAGEVVSWNAAHPECPVRVKDYSVYNTGGDNSGAEQRLALDISTGDAPDMYDFTVPVDGSAYMNPALYARKGLLENLYPYIDSDPDIGREGLLPGPVQALEINGGLYQLCPSFYLLTAFGAKRDVGSPENWIYAALERTVAESEYYQTLYDGLYPRDDWLRTVIFASGSELVDWEKGECRFDSAYFIRLLELAKVQPETPVINGGSAAEIVEAGKCLLFRHTLTSFSEAGICVQAYGEENFAFVGVPEIGNVLVPASGYGISAQSEAKEQCWQFLRNLLFKADNLGVPLLRSAAEAKLESQISAGNTDPAHVSAMREMFAIVENDGVCAAADGKLWDIVSVELGRFYSGDADAAAAAKAIQAKASIYISEQT